MFELNPALDITVIKDIGPNRISAVTIDNFYLDPYEVRRYVDNARQDPENVQSVHHYGDRLYVPTKEISKNVKPIFDELCFDSDIWGNKEVDKTVYQKNWNDLGLIVNLNDEENILANPLGIIPHQDTYTTYRCPNHFGCVVYLNTPDECKGGTLLYSFMDDMTVDESIMKIWEDEKDFDMMRMNVDHAISLKCEFRLNMAWNRCVLYPSDILHCPEMERGWFVDHQRLAQVMFL